MGLGGYIVNNEERFVFSGVYAYQNLLVGMAGLQLVGESPSPFLPSRLLYVQHLAVYRIGGATPG